MAKPFLPSEREEVMQWTFAPNVTDHGLGRLSLHPLTGISIPHFRPVRVRP